MYQYKSPQINIKVKKNCFLLKYVNSSKYEIRFCKFQYFFLDARVEIFTASVLLAGDFSVNIFQNEGRPIKFPNIPVQHLIFQLNEKFVDKKSLTSLEFKILFLHKEHSLCQFLEKHFLWPVFHWSQRSPFLLRGDFENTLSRY